MWWMLSGACVSAIRRESQGSSEISCCSISARSSRPKKKNSREPSAAPARPNRVRLWGRMASQCHLVFDVTNILKELCCLRSRPVFRRSPRQRANQASARVPTRHAGVRAPQWIQHFVRASQKLSGIGRFRLPTDCSRKCRMTLAYFSHGALDFNGLSSSKRLQCCSIYSPNVLCSQSFNTKHTSASDRIKQLSPRKRGFKWVKGRRRRQPIASTKVGTIRHREYPRHWFARRWTTFFKAKGFALAGARRS